MKLSWPEFEKQMRQVTRQEIRRSQVLTAEYTRRQKSWSRGLGAWAGMLFVGYMVAVLFGAFLSPGGEIDLALAVLSLWATGTAFRQARRWFELLYSSDDLVVYSLLPLSDAQIFRIQWRRYILRSLGLLGGYAFIYGTLWHLASKPPISLASALVIAIAQTAMVIAFGLNLAAWLPFLPLSAIAGLFQTVAVVLLYSSALLRPYNTEIYNVLCAISPNGWVNFLLLESATSHDLTSLLLLLPIAIV